MTKAGKLSRATYRLCTNETAIETLHQFPCQATHTFTKEEDEDIFATAPQFDVLCMQCCFLITTYAVLLDPSRHAISKMCLDLSVR